MKFSSFSLLPLALLPFKSNLNLFQRIYRELSYDEAMAMSKTTNQNPSRRTSNRWIYILDCNFVRKYGCARQLE